MKLRTDIFWIAALLCALCVGTTSHAQTRLLGITGNQEDGDQESFPDVTLFEIDTTDAATTKIMALTFVPDGDQIGFNPDDGLLYHTGGSEAWTDDPGREGGFRDHQYYEKVDLGSGEITPIFNANPPESPDEFPSFGLAAPRPSFVLPEKIRLLDDPECEDDVVPGICPREDGENEYHSLRSLTWSKTEKVFYGSDENGVYTLSTSGESTFIGQPLFDGAKNLKGMTFYETAAGETLLLAGTKRDNRLFQIDPETGEDVDDPVELQVPPTSDFDFSFDGLLALAQHPDTGVLYGVRRTDPEVGTAFERELVTIDPTSGETALVGNLGLHFAGLTFVTDTTPLRGDFNNNGEIDVDDVNMLGWKVADGMNEAEFDLTGDGLVDQQDLNEWIKAEDIANSYVGDANVDGEFNSGDLVAVFGAGKYEVDEEASWDAGDWNGDHRFDSGDLVVAFEDGGYELGPRDQGGAIVPEPSSLALLLLGFVTFLFHRKRR